MIGRAGMVDGVTVKSLTENFDLETKEGRFMFAGPGRSRRVRGRAPRTAPARRSWDAGTRPLVRSYARAMTLVLFSGRPCAGKTAFSSWLAAQRGFVQVETDAEWSKWGPLVCVQSPEAAVATRNLARALGPNVVIEWGFKVAHLGCVRQLRAAGFDAWWLDGEEAAARQSYISRQGDSAGVMAAYRVQVEEIREAWPRLERFYGHQIIRTVTSGPTYMPFDEIASIMFPDVSA